MATINDAREIALGLPEASEKVSWGSCMWQVKGRGFAWERPLRKSDLAALGDAAPSGEILGARVADEGEKQALIESEPEIFFTTSHFDGYPAVLVKLDAIEFGELTEVITEAWLDRAPKRLAEGYLGEQS